MRTNQQDTDESDVEWDGEIIAENTRTKRYRVRWADVSGQSWPDSWEPYAYCSDEMINVWDESSRNPRNKPSTSKSTSRHCPRRPSTRSHFQCQSFECTLLRFSSIAQSKSLPPLESRTTTAISGAPSTPTTRTRSSNESPSIRTPRTKRSQVLDGIIINSPKLNAPREALDKVAASPRGQLNPADS